MRYLPRWAHNIAKLVPLEYRYFPDRETVTILMASHGVDDAIHVADWESTLPPKVVVSKIGSIVREVFGEIDGIPNGAFPWFKINYDTVKYTSGLRVSPISWSFISDHLYLRISTVGQGKRKITNFSMVVDGGDLLAELIIRLRESFPNVVPPAAKQTYVLMQDQEGFRLHGVTNEENSKFIPDNYADDVVRDFEYICSELNNPDCGGSIVIFDGPPGSGKTNCIRFLINSSMESKYILIPPEMVASLAGPQLVAFLISQSALNKGKPLIFVLEDADQALVPRDAGNMGIIQSLLNLTDGILGRAFKIRLVCTTNAKSTAIDPAILRAGRLIKHTHIGFLPKAKAQAVLDRLGCKKPLPEPRVKPKTVGFGTTVEEPQYLLADLYALAHDARSEENGNG